MRAAGDEDRSIGRLRRASAFSVHVLTASGAALALLAMLAAVEQRWSAMFAWLGCALIVDGIDGTFARRLDVRRRLPRWSGDVLDLVVDILTYVFVPAYAVASGGLLPDKAAVAAGVLIACTGTLYFADTRMKTADNYFRGFPATWNLVAFYLFLLRPSPWLVLAAIVTLAALTFVPIRFVHPLRVARGRILNIVLLAAWSGLAAVAVASALAPPPWVVAILCALALYFLLAGIGRRS
jgi:phosphatidylcholine synthase